MKANLKDVEFSIDKKETYEDGAKYLVRVRFPMSMGLIENVNFIADSSNEQSVFQIKFKKSEDGYLYYEGEAYLKTKALYHFYFSLEANKEFKFLKRKHYIDDNNIIDEEKWKLSVNFDVPDWAQGKIMYHIFVDRFNRDSTYKINKMDRREVYASWDDKMKIGPNEDGIWNADFYGGNIRGIINKLDYIKDLGVSILYLSPVVWSQSNHRYDTADYEKVDPYAGTNDDLKELCDRAHSMGMKVILDAVFNHTGNDSKYFNEFGTFPEVGAYQSKDSKYFPFYRKWITEHQTYFDYWWGMPNLPVCDGENSEWQQYIYGEHGVIDKWFELGIDGLRLDVADELTDDFIEGIRRAVKRNKEDGFIIGEVWKNPMRMGRGYISSGKGMDSVMDYPLMDALIRYFKFCDIDKLNTVIYQMRNEYPKGTINSLMNFTSTHDISRIINIFGAYEFNPFGEWAWDLQNGDRQWQNNYRLTPEDYERAKQIYEAYIFALTFLPGNLSIFYGDEVGLQGMGNLANRKPFDWKNIDKDILTFFKNVGKIRSENSFLEQADFDIIDINDRMMMFERKDDDTSAFVTVNRTSDSQKLILPERFQTHTRAYSLKGSLVDELKPYGGLVLKKDKRRSNYERS